MLEKTFDVTIDAIYTTNIKVVAESLDEANKKAEQHIAKNSLAFELSIGSIEIAHTEEAS